MIYVDLSVPPYHAATPPHVILSWEFVSWDEVEEWQKHHKIKTDSQTLEEMVESRTREYVQVELNVLEVTGQDYTCAILSVEGKWER